MIGINIDRGVRGLHVAWRCEETGAAQRTVSPPSITSSWPVT